MEDNTKYEPRIQNEITLGRSENDFSKKHGLENIFEKNSCNYLEGIENPYKSSEAILSGSDTKESVFEIKNSVLFSQVAFYNPQYYNEVVTNPSKNKFLNEPIIRIKGSEGSYRVDYIDPSLVKAINMYSDMKIQKKEFEENIEKIPAVKVHSIIEEVKDFVSAAVGGPVGEIKYVLDKIPLLDANAPDISIQEQEIHSKYGNLIWDISHPDPIRSLKSMNDLYKDLKLSEEQSQNYYRP